MIFEVEPNEKYFIARCFVELIDGTVFEQMETELKDHYDQGHHLIIDVQKAIEVTPDAVDALVDRAEKQIEEQRTFVLINAREAVVKAFDDNIPIVPTEHEAIDYFNFDELERQYDL